MTIVGEQEQDQNKSTTPQEESTTSTKSRDPLETLWIKELRHESPPAAARYGSEGDDEMFSQAVARETLKQPVLTSPELENDGNNKQDNNVMQDNEEEPSSTLSQPLSRLQQLRQKKRLLEALPASISTAAAPNDAPDQMMVEDSNMRSSTPPRTRNRPSNNLARIAISSAAVFESTELVHEQQQQQQQQQHDDHSSSASTLSTQMSEMELEEKEETTVSSTAFQETLTITSGTKNPISCDETSFNKSQESQQVHALEEEQTKPTQKRRRMLGLGFLPTSKRFTKRRNTGNDGHQ